MAYPRLVEATGCCPPEDIGGPWSYAEFIAVLADPEHERHGGAGDVDPVHLDRQELAGRVAGLARRWTRKTAAPRAKAS
ncbi:hypothetical protein J3R73_002477 [Labrys monachus]|uniref:Plasmid pRiA4b Orf3-like domain-containing protein n=2 Tax=Labrys monachus TaxID=217067 RepID=A0ABU0FF71_9HYPH|nr:plasmid pRiA4b ORF-3 family protein [Labrys monachus]MDQ0392685.1 hypothetical protein [Labrys monachus]